MNEKSQQIIQKLPVPKQRYLSTELLNSCYDDLHKYHSVWLESDYYKYPEKLRFIQNNELQNVCSLSSIDTSIQKYILSHHSFYQTTTFSIGSNTYKMHFYYLTKHNKHQTKIVDYLNDCLMKIYVWLHFIQPFIVKNCSQTMNVYIIFSQHKKKISKRGGVLDSVHVNSAFTTSCQLQTEIYIYRIEEWMKVFFHETFHCLGLDFSHLNDVSYETKINQMFDVDSKQGIRLYESYCECWANLFSTIVRSFFQSDDKHHYKLLCKQDHLSEVQFSSYQLIKILNHYHTTYEQYVNHRGKITENTPILSYYIIKCVLLYYCSDFEQWCKTYNGKYFLTFREKNVSKFIDFIREKYKTSFFMLYIKNIESKLSTIELTDELVHTMRMTLHE